MPAKQKKLETFCEKNRAGFKWLDHHHLGSSKRGHTSAVFRGTFSLCVLCLVEFQDQLPAILSLLSLLSERSWTLLHEPNSAPDACRVGATNLTPMCFELCSKDSPGKWNTSLARSSPVFIRLPQVPYPAPSERMQNYICPEYHSEVSSMTRKTLYVS